MAVLHERMPVILEQPDWSAWLGEEPADPAALLRPAADGTLRLWQIDKRVGNVRNDGPDLLIPVEPGGAGQDAATARLTQPDLIS
jgi:putative SOS response-associated peptidase YedK